jgi:hypothetical protein
MTCTKSEGDRTDAAEIRATAHRSRLNESALLGRLFFFGWCDEFAERE